MYHEMPRTLISLYILAVGQLFPTLCFEWGLGELLPTLFGMFYQDV